MPDGALQHARLLQPGPLLAIVAVALFAGQVVYGVLPGLRLPAGDFANYYTAARVARSGEDLAPAYTDMLWFQQRIDAAGFSAQLGGFAPQPPATALVMLPLQSLAPLRAKQAWTVASIVLAVACVAVIAQLAELSVPASAVAVLGTGIALANDLALGQFYLPLLLSIAAGLLLVERRRPVAGGLALGVMLPIKPFAIPLLVYFAARRQWRVVGGAAMSSAAVVAASVSMLGWNVYVAYLRQVLPAQSTGRLQDPFHPLWQSWGSLARRMFEPDAVWNPTPAAVAPVLAVAIPVFVAAAVWSAVVVLVRQTPEQTRLHAAVIIVATLLVAPGGASYHFVLLAIPFAVLARDAASTDARWIAPVAIGAAVLLALPLPSLARRFDGGWSTPLAYPRLWLMCGLLAVACALLARRAPARPSWRVVAVAAAVVIALTTTAALRAPGRVYDAATPVPVTVAELTRPDRAPVARPEMLAGELTFLAASPATGRFERYSVDRRIGPDAINEPQLSALSPDRRALAFSRDGDIWLRQLATGDERQLTRDPAIDREPCWRDPTHLVFTSDRGAGLGFTSLYELEVSE